MNFKTGFRLLGKVLDIKFNRIGKPKLVSSSINELGETVSIFKTRRIFGKPHISKTVSKEITEQEINPELLDFLS